MTLVRGSLLSRPKHLEQPHMAVTLGDGQQVAGPEPALVGRHGDAAAPDRIGGFEAQMPSRAEADPSIDLAGARPSAAKMTMPVAAPQPIVIDATIEQGRQIEVIDMLSVAEWMRRPGGKFQLNMGDRHG
jgi:hypothetical protein